MKSRNTKQIAGIVDEMIIDKIYHIRGLKVMLDRDLAEMYGVETRRLNEQVKRNIDRFPSDFMFQLTEDEFENLMSQFATSSWGGIRKMPFAFTEYGVLMLSGVLNSTTAIQVNIKIMRVYTRLREILYTHKDLLLKLEYLEKRIMKQDEKSNRQQEDIQVIFDALKRLINAPQPAQPRKHIGYR